MQCQIPFPIPTPTDPTKDQDPTHAEVAQNSASDEHELTDEQLSNAAGGHVVPPDILDVFNRMDECAD